MFAKCISLQSPSATIPIPTWLEGSQGDAKFQGELRTKMIEGFRVYRV